MKIETLKVENLIAAKHVDIDLKSPINLICGSNEAGKSSIYEAIIHAFTGESTRVSLKKDYKHLVNDGATVGYCIVEYDGGKHASITLPNGAHEIKEQIHSALPYLLDPKLFAESGEDDRRVIILRISDVKRDLPGIKEKLLTRECNAKKVESILPFLQSGFSSAEKQATENVKEARANWKAVTGEVYGDKKAIDWKAVKPEVDQEAATVAKNAMLEIEKEFDAENQKLGALQTEFNNASKSEAELNGLRAKSGKIDRIETKLIIDRKELALITVKVEDAKYRAQGSTPENLATKCPECDAELTWNGKELSKRMGDLHGDEEAVEKLPELEKSLKLLKNSVENGERDLADAKYAKNKLVELEKESKEVISEERINQLKEKIAALRIRRRLAQESLDLLNKNIRLAAEAEEKTKKAAEYHVDAQEWIEIADALSPSGIPGEILSTALKPINDRLKKTAEVTGWKQVIISDDMSIIYGGKPYGLSSQSAKWRVNVMISEAISHVTGVKMFLADEFDLLDAPSRSVCMKWLVNLAKNNEIETVILFGTLKELPDKLPPLTSAYWIQGGVIAQDMKKEAA